MLYLYDTFGGFLFTAYSFLQAAPSALPSHRRLCTKYGLVRG